MSDTVLVVDDDRYVRRLFTKSFAQFGFEVDEAADGQEAMVKLTTTLPRVLILDVNLPDFSGLEIMDYVRQHQGNKAITIFLVSGDYMIEQTPQAAMADCFLMKPVSTRELTQLARRYLDYDKVSAD